MHSDQLRKQKQAKMVMYIYIHLSELQPLMHWSHRVILTNRLANVV